MFDSERINAFKSYLSSVHQSGNNSVYNAWITIAGQDKALNKDVTEFTRAELLEAFSKSNTCTIAVLRSAISVFRAYAVWRSEQEQFEYGRYLFDVFADTDLIDSIRENLDRKTPLTKEEFENLADGLTNYVDAAIMYLLWYGLGGEMFNEIVNLTQEMVDFGTGDITLPNRVIRVPEKVLSVLRKAFDETTYISPSTLIESKLEGMGRIYKERYNARVEESPNRKRFWLYRKMDNIKKETGNLNISPLFIRDSSIFNEISIALNAGCPMESVHHVPEVQKQIDLTRGKEPYTSSNSYYYSACVKLLNCSVK